jgi:hypothetical protein
MEHVNQRRHPRVRIAAIASLETQGRLNANDQAVGSVRDVSRSGIGLRTGQPPLRGQSVTLRIALDDMIHELKARATRISKVGNSNFYDVGLDWVECSSEDLAFLDQVLIVIEQQPQA